MGGFAPGGGQGDNPVSAIPIIGPLLSGLIGLFKSSDTATWESIAGTNDLSFSILNNAFLGLGDAVVKIKGIFKSIWNDVILAVLSKLLAAYKKLRDLLVKIFAPVLKYLHLLRKLYDQYFNQFVKPVLNVLHKVRQFLQIFRLLGFKWAARLDSDIARIENKIVTAYTTLRQYLNIATSWIQLIVDPLGILRRNPLFASVIRSAPELRNALDRTTFHTETAKELDRSNMHNGWFLGPVSAEDKAALQQHQLPPYLQDQQKSVQAAFNALPGLADQNFPLGDGTLGGI